ncbi:hypothetical protein [Fluviispira vulneris]|uniref:hypothetical protein n=1 Tax=Fluviispira vulneris TaxID=2763012 RepID=UPI001645CD7C|nr:hypothetical protein [Fluviispira vulneris]
MTNNIKSPKFFGRPTASWFIFMSNDSFIAENETEYSVSDLASHYKKTKSTIRNVILRNYEKLYDKKFEPKYIINENGVTEVLFKGKFLKKISSDYIRENEYLR